MSDVQTFMARRALANFGANGATLRRQPDQGDGLNRALVDFAPGADWERCRAIIAEAKIDGTWPAMIRNLPVGGAA